MIIIEEKWHRLIYQGKDLVDYYLISKNGEIKSVKTGKIRKQRILKTGYYYIGISLGSRKNKKAIRIHKALMETFKPTENNDLIINHIDGNKLNNDLTNLEWCTNSDNINHAYKNGLINSIKGEEHYLSKFTEDDIQFIRNNYKYKDKYFGIRALSRKYNVAHSTIRNIIDYKTWKHIA